MKYLPVLTFILILYSSSSWAQDRNLIRQIQLSHDNDALKFREVTDRYYSFGLFLGYQSVLREGSKLGNLHRKIRFLPSDKSVLTNELFLKGFTAESDKDTGEPSRPFAGISGIRTTLSFSDEKQIWAFGTILGVRGKISGAEWVQDRFHQIISSPIFEGWRYQLPNKFLFGIHGSYIKPISIIKNIRGISHSNLTLGNYQIQLEQNLGLQIGIFNEINRSGLFNNYIDREGSNKNEFYLIASVFGRAIATDATLGIDSERQEWLNPFDKRNLQAGYHIRFICQTGRFGITAGHTRVSTESNLSEKHSYGSIGLSYSFH